MQTDERRKSRWYFGGVAASMATLFTHPLDLIKVAKQTKGNVTLIGFTMNTIKTQGLFALYKGVDASIARQMIYSSARFALYGMGKDYFGGETFSSKVALASFSGFTAGWISAPLDLVNVRMQNDVKLPVEQRRNYGNFMTGFFRVLTEEGVQSLFKGALTCSVRAALMGVGQMAFYDQFKKMLIATGYFSDGLGSHFTSSCLSGVVATTITQPMDVVKTVRMNSKPGEYSGIVDIILQTAKSGPQAFFKGYVPAFIRIQPQTILLFLFFEQLRLRFGYLPPEVKA